MRRVRASSDGSRPKDGRHLRAPTSVVTEKASPSGAHHRHKAHVDQRGAKLHDRLRDDHRGEDVPAARNGEGSGRTIRELRVAVLKATVRS